MEKIVQNKKIRNIAIAAIVLLLVGLIIWLTCGTKILHRVVKSISPDGTVKYEIYNVPLLKDSREKEKEMATVIQYTLDEKSSDWSVLSETELPGSYKGSFWSSDSQLFVVNMVGSGGNLYIFDHHGTYMRNLDKFLDMQIINEVAFNSNLYRSMLAEKKTMIYEFVQWAKESNLMLIHYSLKSEATAETEPSENPMLSGYFWYNPENNNIYGLVQTSD